MPKYTDKKVANVNENLRVYQYFYPNGVAIYYVPKNDQEEVVKVWIGYPTIAVANKTKAAK